MKPKRHSQIGLTVVEVVLSLTIVLILVGAAMTIGSESVAYAANEEALTETQYQANRAFRRLAEVLRETGWNVLGATEYPRVLGAGTQLEFRLLEDLDGNGFPFDGSTGDLEWGAPIYTLRLDEETSLLSIYEGEDSVWVLGQFITEIDVATFREDATLALNEIRVSVTATRSATQGEITHQTIGRIHLRN